MYYVSTRVIYAFCSCHITRDENNKDIQLDDLQSDASNCSRSLPALVVLITPPTYTSSISGPVLAVAVKVSLAGQCAVNEAMNKVKAPNGRLIDKFKTSHLFQVSGVQQSWRV